MPGRGKDMGDGWETKRRRDADNDWAIVKLGLTGTIRKILIDTAHFKGNYPDHMRLEATHTKRGDIGAADVDWQTIIGDTPLYPDREHLFIEQIDAAENAKFTHVRLNIFPDGGISRLRIFGFPDWEELEK